MATISSVGVGTSGLDVKSIISQLVALEKRPLEKLKLDATTVDTKISAMGEIKSLVSTLADTASKLSSLTGWNAVTAASSDSTYVSTTALGGTLPTNFAVDVVSLAKTQSTASTSISGVVGAGTLTIDMGKWAGTAGATAFTANTPASSVSITLTGAETVADIASAINGANSGVTASVLTDASGQRLMLRSKTTGAVGGFNVTATEAGGGADNTDMTGLSRLTTLNVDPLATQTAADASAKVNGIAVTSSSNTFATTVAGVTFKAEKITTSSIEITVSKDNTAVQANVDAFVKAYNAINESLNEATKYDAATKVSGLFQGDSTTVGLQNMLRAAIQTVTTGSSVYQRLTDVGITQARGGNLSVDSTKFTAAMTNNMDELKNMFRSTSGGAADGIAVKLKTLTTNLLSTDGFFKSKDTAYKLNLKRNTKDQASVNTKVNAFEARLTTRYNALDRQMSTLNGLNAYISQQVTNWNKSTG